MTSEATPRDRRVPLWIDAGAGASGDMLLAALWDAGADADTVRAAVRATVPADVAFDHEVRDGFRVARARVTATGSDAGSRRTWSRIRQLILHAPLGARVRERTLAVFELLVQVEAQLHGAAVDDVHLHEVGGHDSIADVVGTVAALDSLGVDRVTTTIVAIGAPPGDQSERRAGRPDGPAGQDPDTPDEPGTVTVRHGVLPVPVPAVLALAARRGVPVTAGPIGGEACTPTGMALLAVLTDAWGGLPPMRVRAVGLGAGHRPTPGRLGALRAVVGSEVPEMGHPGRQVSIVTSTNVDDLDPRVWPRVLAQVLAVGAEDAWLTPVVMKKGRPGHVLSVLSTPEAADGVRRVVLTETSALGLRMQAVARHTLPRDWTTVDVEGHPVRVKRGWLDGAVVNLQPEWEDAAAAAAAIGVPAKEVLARAAAAARAVSPDDVSAG